MSQNLFFIVTELILHDSRKPMQVEKKQRRDECVQQSGLNYPFFSEASVRDADDGSNETEPSILAGVVQELHIIKRVALLKTRRFHKYRSPDDYATATAGRNQLLHHPERRVVTEV